MQQFKILMLMVSFIFCSGCSTINSYIQEIKENIISPIPTPTIISTPTFTPSPTPTKTPEPIQFNVHEIVTNCKALSKTRNLVKVEGNIYLPEFIIFGYTGWKGMWLTEFLPSETIGLTALIPIGLGPNTMNDLPPGFFSERDLIIRSFDNRIIRHGHTVELLGTLLYEKDKGRGCEMQVERIESLMPKEVLVPIEFKIKDLCKKMPIYHDAMPWYSCYDLAYKKQLVTLKGQILYSGHYDTFCKMGYCQVNFSDNTSIIKIKIVEGLRPNSILISSEIPAPDGWQITNNEGNSIDIDNLTLTGVLYFDGGIAYLMVYEIH